MKEHALSVDGLRVHVGGRDILTGVDLAVASGEVHVLMGPNGSGKSTLAHVLMGKGGYEVSGGRATIDGEDLLAMQAFERARAGLFLAFQQPVEVPGVTLVDVLEATGRDHRGLTDEARLVGMDPGVGERSLNVGLSGGERKRSEMLQLALLRPAIVLADELDTGLDVDGLKLVASRLRRAVDEWGIGLLAITHFSRLPEVLRPDTVHVMVSGRIVAQGGLDLVSELERSGYEAFSPARG